jgi:hypothetical protein
MKKLHKSALVTVIALGTIAVIGLAAAVPCFVAPPARRTSPLNACINNLHQIDGAKEEWALEGRYTVGAKPSEADLAKFIRHGMNRCPSGGVYHIGEIGQNPTCSVEGHAMEAATGVVELVPLGTNAPPLNAILYAPNNRRAVGTVLNFDEWHEFDDGFEKAGVLIRDLNGLDAWVPRTTLSKALIMRDLLRQLP